VRDPAAVDFKAQLDTMLDYLVLCEAECGHKRWRWNVSPRFFYELRKIDQPFSNPPKIPYGASDAVLWGIPITVTTFVEDAELEEIR